MGLTEFLLVVAVGGGIAAVLFATFRGAASEAGGEGDGSAAELSDEQAELRDRRRAVVRSLEEIEADYEAGNLSQADFESLSQRYRRELAALDERIAEAAERQGEARGAAAPAAAPAAGGAGWRTAAAWTAGTIAFVALAWLVMSQALRPRSPDGTITGSPPGASAGLGPVAEVDAEQLAALEREVRADSSNVEALVALGHLYLTLQRYSELTRVTLKALDQDADNPEALTHLGMLLFFADHPEGVMRTFDRALEIDPNFAEALQFKGMVSFMRQDYAAAVEAWERYLEVVPADEASPRMKALLDAARTNAQAGGSQP
jgi:cytochrome c-type biogenesis protein CcmH/NrfG